MLRLTLELLPHGSETAKSTVGVLEIYNDLTGTHEAGNYVFNLTGVPDKAGHPAAVKNQLWCGGKMKGFKRSRGYWSTVKEVLAKIKTDL